MSTKIYGGFRLGAGVSCEGFVADVREKLLPVRRLEDSRFFAREFVEGLDRHVFEGLPEVVLGVGEIVDGFIEEQKGMSRFLRDFDPRSLSFCLGESSVLGETLGIFYCDNRVMCDAFRSVDGFVEYGYWNNSDDYPEGVTREDWLERGRVWDDLLGVEGRPGLVMDSYDLLGPFDVVVDVPEVLLCVPSVDSRVSRVLQEFYLKSIFDERVARGEDRFAFIMQDVKLSLRLAEGSDLRDRVASDLVEVDEGLLVCPGVVARSSVLEGVRVSGLLDG